MTAHLVSLLVVDDDELNCDMLCRRLEMEGYLVTCATGGAQALKIISDQKFDAVLLDVMMPGLNGFDVLKEIRKTYSRLELPVLMVTAKNSSDDIVQAFEAGANDYILKPIDFQIALARLQSQVDQKARATEIRETESRFSLSVRSANDGLWDWNLSNNKADFSTRWKTMLGYQEDEIGDSIDEWFTRVHPEDISHLREAMDSHRAGETPQLENEHRMQHKDSTYRWTMARGLLVADPSRNQIRMAGSQTNISGGKAADPLTGLPNRVLFMDHLERSIRLTINRPDFVAAVLFVDLDRFKQVNDSLGHQAGDELLTSVAGRIESSVRFTDVVSPWNDRSTVARFGGDEFVILLNGIRVSSNAALVADRILNVVSEPVSIQGQEVSVSCSIGIAVCVNGERSADELVRDADIAMYQAKTSGKSCWRLFDSTKMMTPSDLSKTKINATAAKN